MRNAVVIEKAGAIYSADVPDLPGCVATGTSVEETERELRDAIRFHIDTLRTDGLPVPPPTTLCDDVDAARQSRPTEPLAQARGAGTRTV